jgi:hypothetical protein
MAHGSWLVLWSLAGQQAPLGPRVLGCEALGQEHAPIEPAAERAVRPGADSPVAAFERVPGEDMIERDTVVSDSLPDDMPASAGCSNDDLSVRGPLHSRPGASSAQLPESNAVGHDTLVSGPGSDEMIGMDTPRTTTRDPITDHQAVPTFER